MYSRVLANCDVARECGEIVGKRCGQTGQRVPVGGQDGLPDLPVRGLRVPGPAHDVREDALRAELVGVRAGEEDAVEALQREGERVVRGGRDAAGGDDDEARLGGWGAQGGGDCAEEVEQGVGAEVGRVEDETLGELEVGYAAYK